MKNLLPVLGPALILAGLVAMLPAGAQQRNEIRVNEGRDGLSDSQHTDRANFILAAGEDSVKADPRLVSANNHFGFELYRLLARDGANKNILVSPTSIALAMEMTWNGAAGQTERAMEGAMQLQGVSKQAVNQANSALLSDLNGGRKGAVLTVANSLWAAKTTAIKPEFLQRNQMFYHAEIGDLAGAPDNVNDWVSKQTNGKITNILTKSDVPKGLTSLILANAVYFKGMWIRPFPAAATKSAPFTRLDGNKTSCQMMTNSGQFQYYKGADFQAVSLPYGDKSPARISMVLFLPDETSSLTKFQSAMTEANWNLWIQKLASGRGTIDLPRFRFEYGADLKPPLKSLGMGIAFDPDHADFSSMSRAREYIGTIKHKTFINLDENGTEAAAATAVAMFTRGVPSGSPFHITFNRPFACAIRDDTSGAVLFLGSVVDPLVK